MNKFEQNLCEILKGHEGKIFYSPMFGCVTLDKVTNDSIRISRGSIIANLWFDGKYYRDSEVMLFPSKDQRDWNKWIEEQKQRKRTPKTWSEYLVWNNCDKNIEPTLWFDAKCNFDKIGKSCSTLFKIYQLIEVGYGGNVSDIDSWKKPCYYITYDIVKDYFGVSTVCYNKELIAFHTKEQAEEFLKYPENVRLLKDYFMI